jgi:nitrogen fixation protein NifQ
LGLADRGELNALFRRHFPSLVRSNRTDMKWKKFLYRQLCEREGIPVCKAPTCDACADHPLCFGPEAGEPLQALAALAPVRPNRAAATGRRQAQR